MTNLSRKTVLAVLTISLFASTAVANPDHHDGKEQVGADEAPFVDQSGMQGMSGMGDMGGNHMQMMRMMMKMHMSMMGQMHGGGSAQLKNLFSDGATPERIMHRFDTNGDGAIDLTEFQAWDAEAHRPQMVDRFQALDSDGVDAISIDELVAAHSESGKGASMDSGMSDSLMQDKMTDDKND